MTQTKLFKLLQKTITTLMCFWLLSTQMPINVVFADEINTEENIVEDINEDEINNVDNEEEDQIIIEEDVETINKEEDEIVDNEIIEEVETETSINQELLDRVNTLLNTDITSITDIDELTNVHNETINTIEEYDALTDEEKDALAIDYDALLEKKHDITVTLIDALIESLPSKEEIYALANTDKSKVNIKINRTIPNLLTELTQEEQDSYHQEYDELFNNVKAWLKNTTVGSTVRDDVTGNWSAWNTSNSFPTSGDYYLTTDVTVTKYYDINGGNLKLDLNGHTVTFANNVSSSAINMKNGAIFYLCDSSNNCNGKIIATGTYDRFIWISGSSTFHMYGGTITGFGKNNMPGGGVDVDSGTFNMHDGRITKNIANNGGGVCVYGGTFNMKGGTIDNNKAANENGGGVYIRDNRTFTMEGGTISNNEANYGGGVYVSPGSTFNIKGGSIEYNTANTTGLGGGGVFVRENGTVNMTGGRIIYNTAFKGAGIYIWYNSGSGKFTMNGGEIGINYKSSSTNSNYTGICNDGNCTITKGILSTSNTYYRATISSTASTITFNQQSGTGGSTSATAYWESAMPNITRPTRTGYTFAGYYDDATNGTMYYNANGASVKTWDRVNYPITLYAHWTPNPYSVKFDQQLGSNGDTEANATYNSAMPSITLPTRIGYVFDGYYSGTNGSGTKYYNADGSSAHVWDKTSNTTLYANWVDPVTKYAAKVNSNIADAYYDGEESYFTTFEAAMLAIKTNSLSNVTVTLLDNAQLTNSLDSTNSLFNNLTIDLNGKTITGKKDKNIITNNDFTEESSLTIKNGNVISGSTGYCHIFGGRGPVIKVTSNNVNYYANAAINKATSLALGNIIVEFNGGYIDPKLNVEWQYIDNLQADVSLKGDIYYPGTRFIYYDGVTTQNSRTIIYGGKYVNDPTSYVPNGYVVKDINEQKDGYTYIYQVVPGGNLTLNENGGSYVSGYSEPTKYEASNGLTLPTASQITKTGYTFNGWYVDSNFSGSAVENIDINTTGDKTYYAKWEANTNTAYKVEHYKQNSDCSTYPTTATETENKTGTTGENVTPGVKTYTGYTSPSTQTKEILADGSTVVDYYYTRNKYDISYVLDDGSFGINHPENAIWDVSFVVDNPTKTGYTFAGWNITGMDSNTHKYGSDTTTNTSIDKTTATTFKNLNATNNSTVTFTATWTNNQYTVTLDAQGGTPNTSTITATYDSDMPQTSIPTKAGYSFVGYFDAIDDGAQYYNANGYTVKIWDKSSDSTLYAHWSVNPSDTHWVAYITPNANDEGNRGTLYNGLYYYDNFVTAIDDIKDGQTVTLLQNIELNDEIKLNKTNITLDLNNKILSGRKDIDQWWYGDIFSYNVEELDRPLPTITIKNGTIKYYWRHACALFGNYNVTSINVDYLLPYNTGLTDDTSNDTAFIEGRIDIYGGSIKLNRDSIPESGISNENRLIKLVRGNNHSLYVHKNTYGGSEFVLESTNIGVGIVQLEAGKYIDGIENINQYRAPGYVGVLNTGADSNEYKYVVVEGWEIDFNSNDGSEVDIQYIEKGSKVTKPTDPVKDNYIFDGWYTDNETFENEWNFNNDIPTEDTVLYAKWLEPVASVNHNDEITIYTSLQDAFDAADSGDTVTLLVNQEVSSDLTIPENVTLTFNEGTRLTINEEKTLLVNGTLLMPESSYVPGVEMTQEYYNSVHKYLINKGTLEIGATGTFKSNHNNCDIVQRSNMKINAGAKVYLFAKETGYAIGPGAWNSLDSGYIIHHPNKLGGYDYDVYGNGTLNYQAYNNDGFVIKSGTSTINGFALYDNSRLQIEGGIVTLGAIAQIINEEHPVNNSTFTISNAATAILTQDITLSVSNRIAEELLNTSLISADISKRVVEKENINNAGNVISYTYSLQDLIEISIPTAVIGLTYNGSEQIGVEEGEGYTLTGNTAIEAGTYIAIASLKDGYVWSDGTYGNKEIEFTIKDNKFEVSFNVLGSGTTGLPEGSIVESIEPKTVRLGETYGSMVKPTYVGYTFVGWFLGDIEITEERIVELTDNVTLVAHWNKIDALVKIASEDILANAIGYDGTYSYFDTFIKAVNSASENDELIIVKNINNNSNYTQVDKSLKINVDIYSFDNSYFSIKNDKTLTLTGNRGTLSGNILSSSSDANIIIDGDLTVSATISTQGNVQLNNGTISGNFSVSGLTIITGGVVLSSLSSISDGIITGGSFEKSNKEYVTWNNRMDKNQYKLVLNEKTDLYDVTELEDAVSIRDKKYKTLEAALADAEDGDELIVLRDIVDENNSNITIDNDITINLNNHTIHNINNFIYYINGDLTINGEGEIYSEKSLDASVRINSGNVTFNNVTTNIRIIVGNTSSSCTFNANNINETNRIDVKGNSEVNVDGGYIKYLNSVSGSDSNIKVNIYGNPVIYELYFYKPSIENINITSGDYGHPNIEKWVKGIYHVYNENGRYYVREYYEATINNTKYGTFLEAYNAAQENDVINIERDCDISAGIGDKHFVFEKNVTVNTNGSINTEGHKVYNGEYVRHVIEVNSNVNFIGNGVFDIYVPQYGSAATCNIQVNEGGKLTIDGPTFKSTILNYGGEISVISGTFYVGGRFDISGQSALEVYDIDTYKKRFAPYVCRDTSHLIKDDDHLKVERHHFVNHYCDTVIDENGTICGAIDKEQIVAEILNSDGSLAGQYFGFKEAADAATAGQTVKLVKDYDETQDVTINKNITIDLNGYTLGHPQDKDNPNEQININNYVKFVGNGNVHLGVNVNNNGTLEVPSGNDKLYFWNLVGTSGKGKLNVNSGNYYGGEGIRVYSDVTINYVDDASVGVHGGNLTINNGHFGSIYTYDNRTATIKGGTFINVIAESGTINIEGGSFDIYKIEGNVVIKGGKFVEKPDNSYIANGYIVTEIDETEFFNNIDHNLKYEVVKGYEVTLDSKDATTPGTTKVVVAHNGTMPNITIPEKTGYVFDGYYDDLTNGTKYYNVNGTSAHIWDKKSDATLYAKWITVIEAAVAKIESNSRLTKAVGFENGYSYYDTLANAIKDATSTETKITLLKDVAEHDLTIETNQNVTLDLNGKTIDAENLDRLFVVKGSLTIDDSTATGDETNGTYVAGRLINGRSTGKGTVGTDDSELGNAIFVKGENAALNINDGIIENCTMIAGKGSGNGTIYATGDNSEVRFNGGVIRNCTTLKGGAFYIAGSYFEMNGGAIINCESTYVGSQTEGAGAINLFCNTSLITGGLISGCEAAGKCGGIQIKIAKLTITGGVFENCTGGDVTRGQLIDVINDDQNRFLLDNNSTGIRGSSLEITGGTFVGADNAKTNDLIHISSNDENKITGGWYSGNITPKENYGVVGPIDNAPDARAPYTVTNNFYTITYDSNGGNAIYPKKIYSLPGYSVKTRIMNDVPIKDYETFTGWNTMTDGTGTRYVADDVITLTGSITLYAQWQEQTAVVNIHSKAKISGTTISNVGQMIGGGDNIIKNKLTEIKAIDNENSVYRFDHWEIDGEEVGSSTTLQYKFTKDVTDVYAVFRYDPQIGIRVHVEAEKPFTMRVLEKQSWLFWEYYIDGEYNVNVANANGLYDKEITVVAGSSVELSYSGDDFEAWTSRLGMIQCDNPTYKMDGIYVEKDITLKLNEAKDNEYYAKYMANDTQMISSGEFTDLATLKSMAPSSGPGKIGYEFIDWTIGEIELNTITTTEQLIEIISGLEITDKVVELKPSYKKVTKSFNVTIMTLTADSTTPTQYGDPIVVEEGNVTTLEAPEITDMKFAYWILGSDIVSYNEKYNVKIVDDVTYVANYKSTQEEKKPTITASVTKAGTGTNITVAFTATRDVPNNKDKYQVVENGVVYSTQSSWSSYSDTALDNSLKFASVDEYGNVKLKSGTKKAVNTSNSFSGNYTLTLGTYGHEKNLMYLRGYMVVIIYDETSKTEETKIIYTDLYKVSYNTVTNPYIVKVSNN